MEASLNPALLLTGGLVCALVAAGAGWSIFDARLRSRQQRRAIDEGREAFRQRVMRVAAEARARRKQCVAWEGLRELRVSAIVDECRDVKSFYLAAADGRPLPGYEPGQYLTLHLPDGSPGDKSPGDKAAGDKPIVRCYSLSDRPREEFYRITVKLCRSPNDASAPPGVGTTILHERVRVGDALKVAAPRGDFILPAIGADPVVLIGAGIGVTPLLSMLLAQRHAGLKREAYLLLGMRNSLEHPFKAATEELVTDSGCIHSFVAYSKPLECDTEFRDFHHRGRINPEFIRRVLPSNKFRFYVCGPPGLMETVVPALLDWGVPDDRIYFEAFGPASVPLEGSTTVAKAAVGAEVNFAFSGKSAQWSDEDRTLLEMAERLGVPLDAGCRVGNCGSCAVRVVQGATTAVRRPGAKPAEDECLACVSVPTEELVLEA